LKPRILITEPGNYSSEAIAMYESFGEVSLLNNIEQMESSTADLKDVEIVVVRLGIYWSAALLQQLPRLRCIVTPTTGLTHIDMAAYEAKHISILSLKNEQAYLSSIPSTAEFTWSLLLALSRNTVTASNHTTQQGQWNRNLFIGHNLQGKTIGIIGAGRVGKQVARFAQAFGMNVLAYDTAEETIDNAIMQQSVEMLIRQSDIISIHIPAEGNTGFISAPLIELSKPNALWINTSRANVWNEEAIAAAIKTHQIAGIATDVLSTEYLDTALLKNNPLIKAANEGFKVIVTPHIAGATKESMESTEIFMANKCAAWWKAVQNAT